MILIDLNPDLMYIGNTPSVYKSAILGITHDSEHVIYSYTKLIECFINEGMSEDEAFEWFDVNVASLVSYGENHPIVLYDIEEPSEIEIE